MRYAGWIVGAATMGIVVATSCIPDFKFRDPDKGSGAGADGGAGGAGGGENVGGGEDAGVPDGPTVPCTSSPYAPECLPGQACCFHKYEAACDFCGAPETCTGTGACAGSDAYAVFRCNNRSDCGEDEDCCFSFDMAGVPLGTRCEGTCPLGQSVICTSDQDCPPSQPNCSHFMTPYPGYKRCKP